MLLSHHSYHVVAIEFRSKRIFKICQKLPDLSFLGSDRLFRLSVIFVISVVDYILYSKYDQASDLWQQLELTSEIEYDVREPVDWGEI